MSETKIENVEHDVFKFLSIAFAVELDTIKPDSDIVNDWGIEGDEAFEILETFSEQFNVDMSDFDFNKYFFPKEKNFSAFLAMWWRVLSGKRSREKQLLVQDLVRAAKNKKWN